jgi:hypothetical protein
MSEPSFALQQAIVTALSADAGVKALLGDPPRLYDDVPRKSAFPYATLGEGELQPWDTASERGFAHALMFHVWSRYGGRKEAKAVLDALYAVLHDASLSLAGHRLVNLRFEFADIFRDADGETYHAVARYRAVTETDG